jgi:hypothetical protein
MVKRGKFLLSLLLAVLIASIPFIASGDGKRCSFGSCEGGCTCYGDVEDQGLCCFVCHNPSIDVVCCGDYYGSGAYYDVCFVVKAN